MVPRLIWICRTQWQCSLFPVDIFFTVSATVLMSLRPCRSKDFEIGGCRQQSFFILLRWVRPWIVFVDCLKNFKNKLLSHESIFCLKNYNLANLDWTFYATWINLLTMKHNLIYLDWIVNNLIVHNLIINYLNLMKGSIQKQPLATVLQNRCS